MQRDTAQTKYLQNVHQEKEDKFKQARPDFITKLCTSTLAKPDKEAESEMDASKENPAIKTGLTLKKEKTTAKGPPEITK
jgi:hypothetical protein